MILFIKLSKVWHKAKNMEQLMRFGLTVESDLQSIEVTQVSKIVVHVQIA